MHCAVTEIRRWDYMADCARKCGRLVFLLVTRWFFCVPRYTDVDDVQRNDGLIRPHSTKAQHHLSSEWDHTLLVKLTYLCQRRLILCCRRPNLYPSYILKRAVHIYISRSFVRYRPIRRHLLSVWQTLLGIHNSARLVMLLSLPISVCMCVISRFHHLLLNWSNTVLT